MDKDNLTTLIAQGDRKAFEHFYKKEYKKAVFYTNLYLSDYELSKDIAQDAFVAIWVNKESLDTDYPIQPYLYSIIRNKAINLLKRLSVDSKVKNELLKRETKICTKRKISTIIRNGKIETINNKNSLSKPRKNHTNLKEL